MQGPAAGIVGMTRGATMPRTRSAVAAAAIALLALTACSATSTATPSQPAVQQTPAPTPEDDPMADRDPTDEFVPLEVVTDEYGTYQRQTLADDAPPLQWDESLVRLDLLEEHGFTADQARQAQETVARYVAEEFLDSALLDNSEALATGTWLADRRHPIAENIRTNAAATEDPYTAGLVLGAWLPENTTRDGGPRGTTELDLIGIEAFTSTDTGITQINYGFAISRELDTTDEVALQLWQRLSPDLTDSEREARAPELFDGDDSTRIAAIGEMWFGFDPVQQGIASIAGNWVPYIQPSGTALYPDVDDLE
jgi:hypothetical protein